MADRRRRRRDGGAPDDEPEALVPEVVGEPRPPDVPDVTRRIMARVVDGLVFLPAGFGIPLLWSLWVDESFVEVLQGDAGIAPWVLTIVAGALYEILLVSRTGQTIGKRVGGLVVVDEATGDLPTGGAAFNRWAVLWVLTALLPGILRAVGLVLVLVMMIRDPRGRGPHDRAGRTRVVVAGR